MQIPRVGLFDQSSPAGAQTDPFLRTFAKEAEDAPYSLGNRPRVMAFREEARVHLSQNLLRCAHRRTENRRAAGQCFHRHQPEAFQICRRQERSEEHTSELQSQSNLVCRLLLEKKKNEQHHSCVVKPRQQPTDSNPRHVHTLAASEDDLSVAFSPPHPYARADVEPDSSIRTLPL